MFSKVVTNAKGRVRGVVFKNARTLLEDELPCGLFIYCIGYENVVIDGVPTDGEGHIDLKDGIRVNKTGETLIYATGWCAHTPRGGIVDTQVKQV